MKQTHFCALLIVFTFTYNLGNVIFLTGDTHTSWAFEVVPDPTAPGKYNINIS